MNIHQAIKDPKLFKPWFTQPKTWLAWFAFLSALFALPMDQQALSLYQRHTGRTQPPTAPSKEAWLVIGRRGGKSFVCALIAVFLACFRSYKQYLAPGERGYIMVIATDRRQARVIFNYIKALLENVPMLSKLILSFTNDSIDLKNKISIEIHTAGFRHIRGYSVVAALLDEVAFMRSDLSANPDREILNAIRPATLTIPNSLIIGLSSPYRRSGVLYEAYKNHYGKDSAPLVWQATSLEMNPTLDKRIVDNAYEDDPISAAAEYGAQFRTDLESFISEDVLEACIPAGTFERAPIDNVNYVGFVDPSGGSQDSMTLGISHNENGKAVLDAIREKKPPFSPESVVQEFCELLKTYRVSEVTGDRYGGEWPREQFRKHSIEYKTSEKTKSELYLEVLPMLNSGKVELLTSKKLKAQLLNLERRTARSGKDSIDHPPKCHDDVANSAAGALVLCNQYENLIPNIDPAAFTANTTSLTRPSFFNRMGDSGPRRRRNKWLQH